MSEKWADIPGTKYRVSDQGNILSFAKVGRNWPMLLKPSRDTCGYCQVALHGKQCSVARLVLEAFKGGPNTKQANHIDGDKANNSLSNLEWATPKENVRHAFTNGLRSSVGERHNNSKLDEQKVLEIRRLYEGEIPLTELAKKFKVSSSCIWRIVHRKNWRHI